MNTFKIIDFAKENGTILVSTEVGIIGIGLPVEEGKYITGEKLTALINERIDFAKNSTPGVNVIGSNQDEIEALVEVDSSIVAATVISIRNAALAATDWTQVQDNALSDDLRLEWAICRDEWRKIPNTVGFPNTFAWPVPPSEVRVNNSLLIKADGTPVNKRAMPINP